ncbi:MAG: hypothetical protein GWO11_00100 [Desulfuromonadales bacterium]|nr:hypothetical protein [Desulfuromonadales bacterium]NIR32939.1 hypothetical protein [Desulfuromonadales bacterium]NIS42004.1 hypothetical protein [Desulfuromonadales bacterium]
MGLLDDAVAEFERAQQDADRAADCITLKGVCLAEKGDFADAERAFREGLELSSASNEERLSLHYELGLLYEAWERPGEAVHEFRQVQAVRSDFRDVRDKIAELGGDDTGENTDPENNSGGKDRISYV